MNKRPLSVPGNLRKKPWADLTPWQKKKLATHLIVALLYPSLKPTEPRRLQREKAFRVLAAWEHRPQMMAALQTQATPQQGDGDEVISQISEWVPTIFEATSHHYYNTNRALKAWDAWWAHVYLFVLAMLRLESSARMEGSPLSGKVSQARATLMITATNPGNTSYKAERTKLEYIIARRRPLWPILCGLLYCYREEEAERKRESGEFEPQHLRCASSVHDLLPQRPPTATELIDCFIRAPEKVARATLFFQTELTRIQVRQPENGRMGSLLRTRAVLKLPFSGIDKATDLAIKLPVLSNFEIDLLTAGQYRHSTYRGGKEARPGKKEPPKPN